MDVFMYPKGCLLLKLFAIQEGCPGKQRGVPLSGPYVYHGMNFISMKTRRFYVIGFNTLA